MNCCPAAALGSNPSFALEVSPDVVAKWLRLQLSIPDIKVSDALRLARELMVLRKDGLQSSNSAITSADAGTSKIAGKQMLHDTQHTLLIVFVRQLEFVFKQL